MKNQKESDWVYTFGARDILNAAAIARALAGSAAICRYFFAKLTLAARKALGQVDAVEREDLVKLFVAEFNRLVEGTLLYDEPAFEGVALRRCTRKLLDQPSHNGTLRLLNKRLLQDVFPDWLLRDFVVALGDREVNKMVFTVYQVTRVLKMSVNVSYDVYYLGKNGRQRAWIHSRENLNAELETIADQVRSGKTPPTRSEAEVLEAKAKAYDDILKAMIGRIGPIDEPGLLKLVTDSADAQKLLGPERGILKFVQDAEPIMVKPHKRILLKAAFAYYKVFKKTSPRAETNFHKVRLRSVCSFVEAAPRCQALVVKLAAEEAAKANGKCDGSASKSAAEEPFSVPRDVYADELSAPGIQLWMNGLGVGPKRIANLCNDVKDFLNFIRDQLHGLPQITTTVADAVLAPKLKAREEPVEIFWFDQIWTVFLNIQDLEGVFFWALGNFAGLHESEISRLVWEKHITWRNGMPHQIYVPPGLGKETCGTREGRYIDVRFPLDRILLLGKSFSGKIVHLKFQQDWQLRMLLRRLRIEWPQCCMRHTFASFSKAIGLTYGQVAAQLGIEESTFKKWYLRELPKLLAELYWTLPIDIAHFEALPRKLPLWDKTAPIRTLALPGRKVHEIARDLSPDENPKTDLKWVVVSDQPCAPVGFLDLKHNRISPRHPWPSDLEFQVLLFDLTLAELAKQIGCHEFSVAYRARCLGFKRPGKSYRTRQQFGFDREIPEIVVQAKRLLEKLREKKIAEGYRVLLPLKKMTDAEKTEWGLAESGVLKVLGKHGEPCK